jgi:hypothetical protein
MLKLVFDVCGRTLLLIIADVRHGLGNCPLGRKQTIFMVDLRGAGQLALVAEMDMDGLGAWGTY